MTDENMALLREYAQSGSQDAFATLVSRHINLVYSVAMRRLADSHLAEDVTQAVFTILASKAKSLGEKTVLSGWLCRTATNVSADALKIQRRRQLREQEAYMQSTLNESGPDTWAQIEPLLETALAQLDEKDHDALVLRFYENKHMAQVGLALGTSEDAAKMRVGRALEKLRRIFGRQGVTLTATAIAGAISASAVKAAPAGLAIKIAAAAILASTALPGAGAMVASKTLFATTLQKGLLVSTAALVACLLAYDAAKQPTQGVARTVQATQSPPAQAELATSQSATSFVGQSSINKNIDISNLTMEPVPNPGTVPEVPNVAAVIAAPSNSSSFKRTSTSDSKISLLGFTLEDIEAAYLCAFSKYVEWPTNELELPGSPVWIGVLGDDQFRSVLDQTARQQSGPRPIAVRLGRTPADLLSCDIVFIGSKSGEATDKTLSAFAGKPVLTVGVAHDFLATGGMIRFVSEHNRVHFEVNLIQARAAELKLNSSMLGAASKVINWPPGKN